MVIETRMRDQPEALSFFVLLILSLFLSLIDFSPLINLLKPALVSMLICYWVLYKGDHLPLWIVWVVGLMIDLIAGTYLGQHAFGKVLVAWLVLQVASRLRLVTLIQQAMYVFAIVLVEHFIYWLVGFIVGANASLILPFIKATSSALCWPLAFALFGSVRTLFARGVGVKRA